MSSIICGRCKDRHASAAEVRACYAGQQPSQPAWDWREPGEDFYGQNSLPTRTPVTEAGMYSLRGVIYKVQRAVHGSGHLYAKRLVPPNAEGNSAPFFDYAPGAIKQLAAEDRLTLEQAKAFGALYGTCCVCGALLTNEESIAAGIGPVCAGRL